MWIFLEEPEVDIAAVQKQLNYGRGVEYRLEINE